MSDRFSTLVEELRALATIHADQAAIRYKEADSGAVPGSHYEGFCMGLALAHESEARNLLSLIARYEEAE